MVVVLQLDDEASIGEHPLTSSQLCSISYRSGLSLRSWPLAPPKAEVAGPNVEALTPPDRGYHMLASLLACYPVIMSLVSNLDLNDLDAFSRSSFLIRQRLLDFRQQIMSRTLHCTHEDINQDKVRAGRWTVPCARDLVGPCRRCETVSCRNCTIKPPSNRDLPRRHRRLCRACQGADLELVTAVPSSTRQEPMRSETRSDRGPCTCETEGVYICTDCHASKGSDDINYTRVWTWRSRYHSLGFGLGTGIGEGNEGVKCGRSERCLAARDIIVDMDCAEDGKATAIVDGHGVEILDLHEADIAMSTEDIESHREETPGYHRQEIEGIGGVVKKKLKKRVRVGATVREFEDERDKGGYLERERTGKVRGWCAWCDRVILSSKDRDVLCTVKV